jgi:DNA-binding NarL/FixJ family response regulator
MKMNINEMIEVLQAAERGEKIEMSTTTSGWQRTEDPLWNFGVCDYRIAPKKEITLVEALRQASLGAAPCLLSVAADRIELLELAAASMHLSRRTTDELLAEIARRVK